VVEHRSEKPGVVSSILTPGTIFFGTAHPMTIIQHIWHILQDFPEYLPAAAAALTIVALALPLYLGMWYFLRRRSLPFPLRLQIGCLSSFVLFAGLAFIFSSPLANKIPTIVINAYLFVACGMVAYTVVPLVDVFLIEYYLIGQRNVYISPPLHMIINFVVFWVSFVPILRYMLRFNPFALIALPTIATAGIALALQDTLKAFIAGIGLGQLIHIGDWISYQEKEGRVLDINWARTVLRTMQGDVLYIPNNLLLQQPFLNYSSNRAHRFTLKISVAYSAAPDKVKYALVRCSQNIPEISKLPPPNSEVLSFENGFVQYGLFYWVDDYGKHYEAHDKLATRVWEVLKEERFEVPLPFPTYTMEEGFHPVARAEAKGRT
jgi:small-conductance mechanosensitive channel